MFVMNMGMDGSCLRGKCPRQFPINAQVYAQALAYMPHTCTGRVFLFNMTRGKALRALEFV